MALGNGCQEEKKRKVAHSNPARRKIEVLVLILLRLAGNSEATFKFHCFGAGEEGAWPPGAAGGAGVATFGAAAPPAAVVALPPAAAMRFHISFSFKISFSTI